MSTSEPEKPSAEGQHPDEAMGMASEPESGGADEKGGTGEGGAPNPETGVGMGAGESSTFEPEEESDGPQ